MKSVIATFALVIAASCVAKCDYALYVANAQSRLSPMPETVDNCR